MLYRQGDDWFLVGTGAPAKPGDGALKLDGLEVRVDPRAEWRQMYREVYRIERDFLYDPGFHGYDLKAAWDEARAVPRRRRQPARPELPARRAARRAVAPARLPHRRRRAAGREPQVRPARRRLRGRERPAPHHQGLPRRELEPRPAGPADPARGRREGGRVPAGRQRPGAARRGRGLPAVRGDGRQADGAEGRPDRRTARTAAR